MFNQLLFSQGALGPQMSENPTGRLFWMKWRAYSRDGIHPVPLVQANPGLILILLRGRTILVLSSGFVFLSIALKMSLHYDCDVHQSQQL